MRCKNSAACHNPCLAGCDDPEPKPQASIPTAEKGDDRFGIGYGKYWDRTYEDDEFGLWVSVFIDGSFGHLVMSHESCTVEWMEDWPKPTTRAKATNKAATTGAGER